MSDVPKGKTVLITGGTGSFGRALVDVLRPLAVKEIRIFSRDELKRELMRIELNEPRIKFHIGDVRSRPAALSGRSHTSGMSSCSGRRGRGI